MSRSSAARALVRLRSQPSMVGTIAMFSSIVLFGKRPICWMT